MYAVTVKLMCSWINTVSWLIRHLACSCLFAREHNMTQRIKTRNSPLVKVNIYLNVFKLKLTLRHQLLRFSII